MLSHKTLLTLFIISGGVNASQVAHTDPPFFAITEVRNDTKKNLVLKIDGQPKLKIPAGKTTRKTVILPLKKTGNNYFFGNQNIQFVESDGNEYITIGENNQPRSAKLCIRGHRFNNSENQTVTSQISVIAKQIDYSKILANYSIKLGPELYKEDKDRYGIQIHLKQDDAGNIVPSAYDLDIAATGYSDQ